MRIKAKTSAPLKHSRIENVSIMDLNKLFFALVLYMTSSVYGETTKENVSFSVETIWQTYRIAASSCTCQCEDDSWKEDIQAYYDGCYSATRGFRGNSYELADTVVKSLEEYLTKVIYFTNSNSTVVTSSATAIAKSLSTCKDLNQSSWKIIVEFEKVFPKIVEDFNGITRALSDHIGDDLVCTFTNDISDLGATFSKYMREFLESWKPLGCRRRVEFESVLKKLQKLMNTAALINETLLNKCDSEASQDTRESVMVLDLLCFYMAVVVQGINSCVLDVQYDRKCYVSPAFKSSSLSLDYAIIGIGEAVNAVVFPLKESLTALLTVFVDITMVLNTVLKSVLGLVEGVGITVGEVAKNLLGGLKLTKTITNDRTNILKGVLRK
ncbi:uncharacterized protein LOC119084194 [Bradysia coprophila]|uniref:uncharacterized protein LOC119084194 n=1 Tax=Bradysia coprophila TaxID=38358 RepID=UPI00187D77AF|nr:uncharacterized protein LOC119084194 [Bradysia coprophila]